MFVLPPPGYVPPKPLKKRSRKGLTVTEAFRTVAKLADGYNKVAGIQAIADVAKNINLLIRG